MVNRQVVGQALGRGRFEGFVERALGMGVQIVHDQHDRLGPGIMNVEHVFHGANKIGAGEPGDTPHLL